MKGRNAEFENSTKIRVMRLSEKYAKKDFIGSQNDSIRSLCKFNRSSFLEWLSVWPIAKKNHVKAILDSDFIVFMVAEKGLNTRLLGVYKVNGLDKETNNEIYIKLAECSGFDALNEKIIVEWGEKNNRHKHGVKNGMKMKTKKSLKRNMLLKLTRVLLLQ